MRQPAPMLVGRAKELFDDPGWTYEKLPDVPAQWVRPAVVVEVEYRQRNGAGLQHAVLKGIRPDQLTRQVGQSYTRFDNG
jgi:ATP-dependent DNA ligase